MIITFLPLTNTQKMTIYIAIKVILSFIISVTLGSYLYMQTNKIMIAIISTILLYIPIETLIIQIMQYILGKIVKPTLIPKLDFQKGIPKENKLLSDNFPFFSGRW